MPKMANWAFSSVLNTYILSANSIRGKRTNFSEVGRQSK